MSSPKEEETIYYCESFGYGGQGALDQRFYRSNGVSVPTKNGSNIPIMGFSLTSPYNRIFKSSHQSAFQIIPLVGFSHQCPTAKHKQQNNYHKQQKKASTSPNSSTKATNNKIRSSTTK
jgi:hypothetical protein